MSTPKAFISYSWDNEEHKVWVKALSERLRSDGVDVTLDQWHVVPGDQLPEFMENAIRESNYVLIICTARYKDRSEKRTGGVGYEGDIITGEVLTSGNQRKFIPLLRTGPWAAAAPNWLSGKYYVDFSGNPYSEASYQDLLTTMIGTRPTPPSVESRRDDSTKQPAYSETVNSEAFQPIRITGIIVDEIGVPRGDGTRGSALYRVPFKLSHRPPYEWSQLFIQTWNHPSTFTTMHRPGIASIIGDQVILDGTTVEEIEKDHRSTLILAANEANRRYQELEAKKCEALRKEQERVEKHKREVEEAAKRMKFE